MTTRFRAVIFRAARFRAASFRAAIVVLGGLLQVLMFCPACTKVINLSVPNAAAQIVIEGNVTNGPGPYQVSITTTVPFSANNNFPTVDGAQVTITDNAGLYDSLVETAPGIYSTQGNWVGQPGNAYTLRVSVNGGHHTGTSTMPQPVNLDSVTFEQVVKLKKTVIEAVPNFQDPPGVGHYYQFTESINGSPLNKIFVFSDRLAAGNYIRQPLADDSVHLQAGDYLSLNMYCLDENTYNYFFDLAQQQNTGTFAAVLFTDVAPANPNNNLSGGALGYFSANTTQTWAGYVNVP
jgi:hypothetical protein